MSESKHTQGPWSYHYTSNHDDMIIDSEDDTVIYHAANWPVDEANARLIAAAPDLLGACEAVAIEFECLSIGLTPPECTNKDNLCVVCQCQAAIAKAKGE